MSILAPLKRIFALRSNSRDVSVPVSSESQKIAITEWVDDTQLRELARESRENITSWVLASDMAEFYSKFNAYNEGRTGGRVYLKITKELSEKIEQYRASGAHLTPEPGTVPVVWGSEEVFRYLGPQYIGEQHMRFEQGTHGVRASYSSSPLNTSMFLHARNGLVQIDFGMDPFEGKLEEGAKLLPSFDL